MTEQPPRPITYAVCDTCGKTIAVNKDGKLRLHTVVERHRYLPDANFRCLGKAKRQ